MTTDGSDECCGRGREVLRYQLVGIMSNTYIFILRKKNKTSFMVVFEFFMRHVFGMINTAITSTVSVAHKLGQGVLSSRLYTPRLC